jgi:hypothetical protein
VAYTPQYFPTYFYIFLVISFILTFPPISYKRSSSPHVCCMHYPSHCPWLDAWNYTWRRVHVMNLLVVRISPTARHFIFFGINILNTPFSNTYGLCSSLNIRDQVSHPYRITHKSMVFVLIFTCLNSRRDNKRFWTECQQALPEFNLLLVFSWIKFLPDLILK